MLARSPKNSNALKVREMISPDSIQQALTVQTELSVRNIAVVPTPGSLLHQIANCSSIFTPSEDINLTTAQEVLTTESHNDAFTTFFDQGISMMVNGQTALQSALRTVFLPRVNNIAAQIETTMPASTRNISLKVTEAVGVAPLNAPEVRELIKLYSSESIRAKGYIYANFFGEKSEEELRRFFARGTLTDQAKVDKWIASFPRADLLSVVWRSAFQTVGASQEERYTMEDMLAKTQGPAGRLTKTYAVVLLVIAHALKQELIKQEAGSNPNYTEQTSCLHAICVKSAAMLALYSKEDVDRNKTVIIGGSSSEVVVDEEAYSQFIEAGGCVEVVMGAAVSNSSSFTINDLMSQKDRLCKEWSAYVAARSLLNREQQVVSLQSIFEKEVYSVAQEFPEKFEKRSLSHELNIARDLARSATITDYDRPYDLCLRLMYALLTWIPAEPYINAMRVIEHENPDACPETVMTLAGIDYVATFLVSMMEVRKADIYK